MIVPILCQPSLQLCVIATWSWDDLS